MSPPGVAIITWSPNCLPIKACAIGESLEILPENGSASALPTIVYSFFHQFLKVTVLPMETSSWSTPSLSMISAKRIIFSNVVIRPSTKACSSLADSYSEFSERSPKLRAILIRSTIFYV